MSAYHSEHHVMFRHQLIEWSNYSPASISFTIGDFALNGGDILSYESGDINGCAPASISLSGTAFATLPLFDMTNCGDGTGTLVDGLFFKADIGLPSTTGVFASDTAGRAFDNGGGSIYYYTTGTLTIDQISVPEPSILALFAAGFFGIGIARRKRA